MLLSWLITPALAQAVLTVEAGGAYTTVGSAVSAAAPGDTIEIVGPATYAEPNLVITKELTIRGVGDPLPVLQSTAANFGVFRTNAAVTLTLEDLVLDGLGTNRVLYVSLGSMVLERVTLRDGYAASGSGAVATVAADPANALVVRDSVIDGGTAVAGDGGLIAVLDGALTIERSELRAGTAGGNGGLVWFAGTDLTIVDSLLEGGTSSGTRGGGGLYADGSGALRVDGSTFASNTATASAGRGGGGVYVESMASVSVADSWFLGNVSDAGEGGGAFYLRGGAAGFLRTVWCENAALADGGGLRLHGGTARFTNALMLSNTADRGGAAWADGGNLIVGHTTAALNVAGTAGHALGSAAAADVRDSWFGDHPGPPQYALFAASSGALAVEYDAFERNGGGDYNADVTEGTGLVFGGGLPTPSGPCVLDGLLTPAGPLVGAASDGGDLGAFGGPDAWHDADGDGSLSLFDCDDDAADRYPGAIEGIGDGVDQDCDGQETCFADDDGDGFGEPGVTVASADLDCDDPGEAATGSDTCPGWPDYDDADGDGVPDGCDPCPTSPYGDSDQDGVCDADDVCHGGDDNLDTDGDGIPNGCEVCDQGPDADGDGVADDCDLCPDFDDAQDRDADGRPDDCDPCVAAAVFVDADQDGICDADDPCPDLTGGDADGDGICDAIDPCPDDPSDRCLDTGAPEPEPVDERRAPALVGGGPAGCGCDGSGRANPGALVVGLLALSRRRSGSRGT